MVDDLTLTNIAVELEQHVAAAGWDQPARLYALVDTAELMAREPQLATTIGASSGSPYTSVEQESLPDGDLDEVLAALAWPDEVIGCALVHEVLMLPAGTEAPDGPAEVKPAGLDAAGEVEWAAAHPGVREIRLTVAVLRDGTRAGCLRLRSPEAGEDDVLVGADLVPNLAEALIATLR